MTVITNWALMENQGVRYIIGNMIDNPPYEDGEDITTSAIQFSEGNTIQTTSGSTYHLAKPAFDFDKDNLTKLQGVLPRIPLQQQPFTGVLENWQPVNINGQPRFEGQIYGHPTISDGETITTSPARDIQNRRIVTGNSTYALGTPHPDVPRGAKEALIRGVAAKAFDIDAGEPSHSNL